LLVIKRLHYLSKAGWSFSNIAVMLDLNLFTYRDLLGWRGRTLRHAAPWYLSRSS